MIEANKAEGYAMQELEPCGPRHTEVLTGRGDRALVFHCNEAALFGHREEHWVGIALLSLGSDGRPTRPLGGTYQSFTIAEARDFAAGVLSLCDQLDQKKGMN